MPVWTSHCGQLDAALAAVDAEIEERKNQHYNELMKNHEDAFSDMKEYYNDITRENLELIRMHKEKMVEINSTIDAN